jgi:hypothetical protein
MERETKLGWGFLLVSAAVGVVAPLIFGRRSLIFGGIALLVVGLGFLISANSHAIGQEVGRNDWSRLFTLFVPLFELGLALAGVLFVAYATFLQKPQTALVYPAPRGPLIKVERHLPTPSSEMCQGLSDELQIQCLCPRPLDYTLKALPAPEDNNYATEITITKPPEQFQNIRVFLRAMISFADVIEIVPSDKEAKSVTTLGRMEYDRFSFVMGSSAPKISYRVAVHSSEQMNLKCVNQEN